MRTWSIVSIAGLMLAVVLSCEQSPTPVNAKDEPGSKVASAAAQAVVVDLDAVAKALGVDEAMTQQLKAFSANINDQLEKIGQQLKTEIETKQEAVGKTPTDEQKQELATMANDANRKFNNAQQEGRMRIDQAKMQLAMQFRQQVADVAKEIAQKRGAVQVVAAGGQVLWFDAQNDITGEVIDVLRKKQAELREKAASEPQQPAGSGSQPAGTGSGN